MIPSPPSTVSDRANACRAIIWGGLLCGIFDITFAFVYYGRLGATPLRILRSVASGLLGREARQGGIGTAALGLFLHFLIAFIWAGIFWAASRKLPVLTRHPVVSGLVYGVVVYLGMNLVVLPLSAFPGAVRLEVVPAVAHMILVGLPIALAAHRFSR